MTREVDAELAEPLSGDKDGVLVVLPGELDRDLEFEDLRALTLRPRAVKERAELGLGVVIPTVEVGRLHEPPRERERQFVMVAPGVLRQ